MKENIDRLTAMIGSDGGFFILAMHSFIEHYMRSHFPSYDKSWTITFNTNLYNYKKYLIEKYPGQHLNELSSFKSIMDQGKVIDSVRHDFDTVSSEEVRAATFNFLQFCKAVGIDENLLTDLKNSLSLWDQKKNFVKDVAELGRVKEELYQLKKENNVLLSQYKEFEEIKAVKKYLESRIETLNLEIDLHRKNDQEKSDKLGLLMKNQVDLKHEKEEIENKISRYENIDRYLKNLLRVSLYTRTRMDYERSLTKLTTEQKDIISSITLKSDFLVKGGAGTGKTMVLLEAMKEANAGVLAFASKKILLLTYTSTLVKYDRYISEIMKIDNGDFKISTSDSYLNGIFDALYPELEINYSMMQKLCREGNKTTFFDEKQLHIEIEDFIYGYSITEKEYIDEMINRKGLKCKLSVDQRREIWDLKTSFEKMMINEGIVSKAFSRDLLIERISEQVYDHIFIDESQDLYPVELQILKKLSKSSLVMAGDTDQSIYGIGSPFNRAGISSGRTTRILKTNFRNTIPIHELAEAFRKKSGSDFDKSITPKAFRDGPAPELYLSDDTEILYDQLVEKVKIFLDTIEYDPENICILAPSARFLGKIKDKLDKSGIPSVNIKDPDFTFKSAGNIRLSPFHSSKGLDIPVVLLFLPMIFYNKELKPEESETLVRNLIYVSMTRAMENLNVFAKKGTSDPIISDLISLMEK